MTSRRDLLLASGVLAMAPTAFAAPPARDAGTAEPAKTGSYVLPPLPYATNALDGFVSSEILEVHHGKHHAGYVKGLNDTLGELDQAQKRGDFAGIKSLERALAFHGSGHVLHSHYWNSLSPQGGGEPKATLKKAIEASFGTVDAFRKQFVAAAKNAESNAWAALVYEPFGDRLTTVAIEDHQNMVWVGAAPLLVLDVWEHAYYLRYKNDRPAYVDKFFEVANWDYAEKQLARVRRPAR